MIGFFQHGKRHGSGSRRNKQSSGAPHLAWGPALAEYLESRRLLAADLSLFHPNLLVNPSFSSGNTGFSSQYIKGTQQGRYVIGTNPAKVYPGTFSFGDHTTGSGLMLMANGATSGSPYVWGETVNVTKHASYDFSGFTASLAQLGNNHTDPSPARLAFYVNGVQVGGFYVAATDGKWGHFIANWSSGNSATASIKIVDLNHASNGNDFALDDLSFAASSNLLVNPSFSSGNTGFSSQYVKGTQQGRYVIGTNPAAVYPGTFSFGDHTTGNGLMLMANGATTGSPYVWGETVSVMKNVSYDFTGFAASLAQLGNDHTDPSPARLAFYVNGVQVGGFNVAATDGKWGHFIATWSSGNSATAAIKIVDLNHAAGGNDFALDDLSFAVSSNLLVNPNFTSGNTGFSSQYVKGTKAGGYVIGKNPAAVYPGTFSFGDHTTGSGLMLMANGATSGNPYVWAETVNVTKNANYDFSGFAASLAQLGNDHTDPSPARLAVYVNGVRVGGFNVAATDGKWGGFVSNWSSGNSATATIKIVDLNHASGGNDFALDDLRFART